MRFTDLGLALETAVRNGHGVHKIVTQRLTRAYTDYHVISNAPQITNAEEDRWKQFIGQMLSEYAAKGILVSYEFIQCPHVTLAELARSPSV